MDSGKIEIVKEFNVWGFAHSKLRKDRCIEVEQWVTRASRAFGGSRKAVFLDKNLKLRTKMKIGNACVLSVLLYQAECWVPLRRHRKKLDTYHQCIRTILGMSNKTEVV